jgi:hypothetical protein
MEERNCQIVLTVVPEARVSYENAEQLASLLKVPLVAPRFADLNTRDGSHLTDESARRFADAFFDAFIQLPLAQAYLK